MVTTPNWENRLFAAVVAGAVGVLPLSELFFEVGTDGSDVATALFVVSFAFPALVGWLLYPGVRAAVHDSQIDHGRLVGWLYYLGGFCVFFGVGASAAYAVGTQVDFGEYLLAWTATCGVVAGVGCSVWFWRD